MSCSYLRGWQVKSRLVRGPKVRRTSRSLFDFVAKNLDLMWPATGNMWREQEVEQLHSGSVPCLDHF